MTDLEVSKIIDECEKNALPDSEIDYSAIPPVRDFSGFHFANSKYLSSKHKKQLTSIRLDASLLDYLKSKGKGWKTELNDFLVEAVSNGML